MTRMKTPPPPDPFKAHLLAVLGLQDAATPVLRFSGPRDSQTDAILRKVEALMRKTGGTPDSEASYDTAVEEHAPIVHGSESRGPADDPESVVITRRVPCPVCGHRLLRPVDYAEHPVTALVAVTTDAQEIIDAREELRLLKEQIHDISRVCSAIAVGDLTQRVTVPVQDEGMVKLKEVINTMVDTFGCFSTEVTRVLVDLRTGRLGSCALVDGAQGTWYDLTENVNTMSSNLTAQVRAIARATTAIAHGDLSVRVDTYAGGEFLDLKETVNEMAMRLGYFASEIGRIAVEVGTEGRMGGQAEVHGAQGTWADLAEKINRMGINLTGQIRSIGIVIREVALGNFGWMVDAHMSGEMGDIKDTLNGMVGRLQTFSSEVNRLALDVGTEGGVRRSAVVPGAQGAWADLTENLNIMASNLTNQVLSIAHVSAAVARGDLSKRMDIDVSGEMLDLKVTINEMVQRLEMFSREATRTVREVGTEGKLGGEVEAEGMEGTWRDLTDNINRMARNLRDQVRTIAVVTKGISQGDLGMTIQLEMRGEMGDLKDTINTMVAQFRNFSSEVTRLALEVGTYGLLGGHAEVPGALGTWKDLTDTLNRMAGNLTNQVRSISYVAMVAARGDLTKAIDVDARGEMQDLKVNVQEVVARLSNSSRETSSLPVSQS